MSQQLKKLTHNKKLVDTPSGHTIAEWRLNPWKVSTFFLVGMIGLIILYGMLFTDGQNQEDFFRNMVFYSIVIVIVVAILWVTANVALKFRKLIVGFVIAFILILVFYWFLGLVFNHFDILRFYMGGKALWVVISFLAGLGAKRIDGNLDRNDIGYGLLVFLILIGCNIPIVGGVGFIENIDLLLENIWSTLNVL